MTPEHIAMLIAAPIIVLIILWAPLLDFIGPPWRFLQPRREEEASNEVPFSVEIPNALPEQLLHCSALAEESMRRSKV
jgi:hypothetical protein